MTIESRRSFCRICHAACPVEVDVEDGVRVVGVRGVRDDPLFEGYTCIKGRQLADHHHHPDRIRSPLRRGDSGFEPISSGAALDEIAARISEIVERDGPRAVATYVGTGSYQNAATVPVASAWHAGFSSPSFYTSLTIDQPAHRSAALRMGSWEAGWHNFSDADVLLAVGYNSIVSSYGPAGGLQGTNPVVALRRARQQGMKLIVIDPRRTELAAAADIWLQVRPGEDPTLLAGLIREILSRGLHDSEFCSQYIGSTDSADGTDSTDGVSGLAAAVEPFDLNYVSKRAGVNPELVRAAAELFAAGPKGSAGTGTGPNMAPHGTLTEHLTLSLNAICGRVNRAGDRLESGYFLFPGDTRRAQVVPPSSAAPGAPHRVRGLAGLPGEMLSNALADEILMPGDGRVRALIVTGGNPVVAFPDQAKTIEAMRDLELLVVVDHRLTATAELADFVIAPRLQLERADVPHIMDRRFAQPYSNYTPAVLKGEGDLLADWEVFAGIAARNNTPIGLPGGNLSLDPEPGSESKTPINDDTGPDDDTVLDLVYGASRIPMDEIRTMRGEVNTERAITVVPADPDADARFSIAPPDVVAELAEVADEVSGVDLLGIDEAEYPYRLVSRRLQHVLNSMGRELPGLAAQGTTNHAYLHPEDAAALGVASGDLVLITSPLASITGVVETTSVMKPGAVAMSHAWGTASLDDPDVRSTGSPTNRLVSNERGTDPITGMAVQSAIPVRIEAHSSGAA